MQFVESSTTGTVPRPGRPALRSVGHVPARPVSQPGTESIRRQEGGHTVWRVQCGDVINRERCVTVFVDDSEVVLISPPGETTRLTGGQLGQLRAALNEAAKLAER